MLYSRFLLLILVVGCAALEPNIHADPFDEYIGSPDCNPKTIKEEILKARKDVVDPAIKAGDAVGAAKVFAPDIYFVTTGVPTMRSRQETGGLLSQMINKRGVKGLVLEREKYVCLDSFAAEIHGEVVFRDFVVWKKIAGSWQQAYSFNVGDVPGQ